MDFLYGLAIGFTTGYVANEPTIVDAVSEFLRGEHYNPFPDALPSQKEEQIEPPSLPQKEEFSSFDDELDEIFETESSKRDVPISQLIEEALAHKNEEHGFAKALSQGAGKYLTSGKLKELKEEREKSRFRFTEYENIRLMNYFAEQILGKKNYEAKGILERQGFEMCTGEPMGYRSNRVYVSICDSEVVSIDCIGGSAKTFVASIETDDTIDVSKYLKSGSESLSLSTTKKSN